MEGEEIRLEVLVAADGDVRHVELAEIELDSRAENRRPEMRHLQRITADLQVAKWLVEWQEDERVQALQTVVRQIQFGDADVDEWGRVQRHHLIPGQWQWRQIVAYIAGDCMERNKTTTDKLISYYSFFGFLVESLELKEESLYSWLYFYTSWKTYVQASKNNRNVQFCAITKIKRLERLYS